ncbi:MAG: glutamate-cysteine ligase family protein [Candidatus Gastranaerophilales bacterium]
MELSLEPEHNISQIEAKVKDFDKKIKPILKEYGINLLNYGVSPVSTNKNINLIPKSRYAIMAKYLWGILSDVMMRETAGIQTSLDFKDEADAMRKYKIANQLTPFMTAMFANSPIRGGVDTGYKSFRALSWLNTDNERCGFAGLIDEDFSFEKYIDCVLNSPMIFIDKNGTQTNINGKINFKEYMQNNFEGNTANLEDYELHANLYFPEVRLRNYIEIRNHDCVNKGLQYSILAIYKGILYNNIAMDEIDELFKKYNYNDFSELRYNVPKNALNTKISTHLTKDIAKEILNIAEKSLISQNQNEEKYLDPIKELTNQGICPADIILRNWHGVWNKDINKLIQHVSS